MIEAGSVYRRTEPKDDPLDVIRVVGASPVRTATVSEWVGSPGDHVIVTPQETFGSNEVVPEGAIFSDYELVSVPAEPIANEAARGRPATQLTPEQQFARMARDAAKPTRKARA